MPRSAVPTRQSTYRDEDHRYATIEAGLPDAVWRRALRRAELPVDKQHPSDNSMLDAATAYLCGVRATDVAGDNMWRAVLADVEGAVAVHDGDALDRAVLEARILSRQSDVEIAERSGLSVGPVAAFEALYFAVRDKLHAPLWVSCQVIASPTDGTAPCLGAVLKKFGYFAGSEVLEVLVPIAQKCRRKDPLDYPYDVSTEAGLAELSARLALAIEMIPRNEKSAMFLMHEHGQQIRRELELRRISATAGMDGSCELHLTACLESFKTVRNRLRREQNHRRKVG